MEEQAGLIYWVSPENIATPNTNEGLRLFRSLDDGKYYLKKQDGTYILLTASAVIVTEVTIDITGLSYIDVSGYSGEIVVNAESSNSEETIDRIINAVGVTKVTIRPASGLDITFQDKSIGGPEANLHLRAEEQLCLGTLKGFIQFEYRDSEFYEINFIDQYAS